MAFIFMNFRFNGNNCKYVYGDVTVSPHVKCSIVSLLLVLVYLFYYSILKNLVCKVILLSFKKTLDVFVIMLNRYLMKYCFNPFIISQYLYFYFCDCRVHAGEKVFSINERIRS